MSDVSCPYCDYGQDINHDDGYGYSEDETYEQECVSCERSFEFTTSILYCYYRKCDENVMPHNWEDWDLKRDSVYQGCTNCDATRRKP